MNNPILFVQHHMIMDVHNSNTAGKEILQETLEHWAVDIQVPEAD